MINKIKNIFNVFVKEERKKFVTLYIFSILASLLEVVGFGALFSLIYIIIEGNNSIFNEYILNFKFFLSSTGNINIQNLSYFIFIIFIIKIIITFFIHIYRVSFFAELNYQLSKRLLVNYLDKNYNFFFKNNSAQISQNITHEVELLINRLVQPFVNVSTELFFLSIFFITIFYKFKMGVFFLVFFFLFFLLFHRYINNLSVSYGMTRRDNDLKKVKLLKDIFNLIKQVKIQNLENLLLNKYLKTNFKSIDAMKKFNIMEKIPFTILETIIVSLSIFFIIYFVSQNAIEVLLVNFSIFTIIVVRSVPSINKISSGITSINYSYPIIIKFISQIGKKYKLSTKKNFKMFNFKKNFVLNNISYSYPNSKTIFKDLKLDIKKNSIIGIYGKSGAGKTTFVDLLVGLIDPTKGNLIIDNSKNKAIRKIGYLTQNTHIFDESLEYNIALESNNNNINREKIIDCIKMSELNYLFKKNMLNIKSKIGENGIKISGGEKQRIGLARLFYGDYSFLIFDEATSSLDVNNEVKIMKTIKKLSKNKTVIIISHNKRNLNFCEKIYEIKNLKLNKIK